MTLDHGVVIVGAGPAGIATGLSLLTRVPAARARVIVLERARFPRDKICAGAISDRGWAVLAQLGVRLEVPAARVHGFALRGAFGCTQARPGFIGRVVRRIELDHALARAAIERGMTIEQGVRVRSIEERADGVVLETTRGALRASIVVGADGVASVVRRSMNLGPDRFRAQAVEVDTDARRDDLPSDLLGFDVTDPSVPGYAWDFPTIVGGSRRICRGVYRLRDHHQPGDAAADLRARLRRLSIPVPPRMRHFSERGYDPQRPTGTLRRMLVGEAAGIDPLTGEGIAPALEMGMIAGRFLAERLSEPRPCAQWTGALRRSRIGRDLAVRAAAVSLFYGRHRATMDRLCTSHGHLLHAGGQHFAGHRVQLGRLTRALFRAVPSLLRRVGHPPGASGDTV